MDSVTTSPRARERIAFGAVFALSIASWFALAFLVRDVEAWDSLYYFATVLPLSIVTGAICGRLFGRGNWRWPVAFASGQFASMLLLSRGDMSLWPLTLGILFVLMLPCWCAAMLASLWRRRVMHSAS